MQRFFFGSVISSSASIFACNFKIWLYIWLVCPHLFDVFLESDPNIDWWLIVRICWEKWLLFFDFCIFFLLKIVCFYTNSSKNHQDENQNFFFNPQVPVYCTEYCDKVKGAIRLQIIGNTREFVDSKRYTNSYELYVFIFYMETKRPNEINLKKLTQNSKLNFNLTKILEKC
jgi:hypothetical protein